MFENSATSLWLLALALLYHPNGSCFGEVIQVPKDCTTINQAVAKAQAGDTIVVAHGVYFEELKLKPKVTLRSMGDDSKGNVGLFRAEKTIIDGSKWKGKSGIELAEGSVLDGFTIRNFGKYNDKKWKAHFATNGNDQPHEHIGVPSRAPVSVSCKKCVVKNNIVHHNGFSGIVIDGSQVEDSRPEITRNICYRNMGAGISALGGTKATIHDNHCFENFYAGIGQNQASPRIRNNSCHGNIRAGIGISNGSCPIVEKNRCYRNRRAGIGSRTGKATQPIIRNNECFENEMAGIGSEEDATPVIVDNRCYKNKLAGIGCRDHSSPTIAGNHCYENAKAGIGSDGDSTPLIVGNFCERNATAGIGFAPCEKGKARVLNNRILDNKLVAIGVNSGWEVDVVGNQLVRRGGMPPLVMIDKGATANFVDNKMKGGGVACVRCAGALKIAMCELSGNSLRESGPPNFGILALPGSRVLSDQNVFANWRHAIRSHDAVTIVSGSEVKSYFRFAFVMINPRQGSRVVGNVVNAKFGTTDFISTDQPDRLEATNNRSIPMDVSGDGRKTDSDK